MSQVLGRAGRLVIGIGNPSRGDDALGPLAVERLEALGLPDVELLTDFQLQVEYLLDMEGREEVVFIDASVDDRVEAYAFQRIHAVADDSYSSHALSPPALLAAYERHYRRPPPPCHVLAIRARAFELGEGLSPGAATALEAAVAFLARRPNMA